MKAWFEVSTGRTEVLPVLLPVPWPRALTDVLAFARGMPLIALQPFEHVEVRPIDDWPDMASWSIAQVLLHRRGIDARGIDCPWGFRISIPRQTLIVFGRGARQVDDLPMGEHRGLNPVCEWYLAHLPSDEVAMQECSEASALF